MKNRINSANPFPSLSEDDIREYAYHLYVQNGCQPGRDLDNWLEAKACLCASIPPAQSHTRLHRHTQPSSGTVPTSSPSAGNLISSRRQQSPELAR